MTKPVTVLCVLDGLGLNPETRGNAVAAAKKPNLDRLLNTAPNSTLCTHGLRVGLPEGQMGNSEVGHLNIGAGRVVEQWLVRIGRELSDGTVASSQVYQNFLGKIAADSKIHFVGLFSDGGVHSHAKHLLKLLGALRAKTKQEFVLHLITDGRDVSPQQAGDYLGWALAACAEIPKCVIGSVSGRFFAMDRDNRWDRTEKAFKTIALAKSPTHPNPLAAVQASYAKGVTDEFIEPFIVTASPITAKDSVIFWNFRADRMRQIVPAISLEVFSGFDRGADYRVPANTLCFCEYDMNFGLPYIFSPMIIKNHLGAVVSAANLKQLRTAETEKYPHVTYFLNGGVEEAEPGETRQLVPSPREVKTYDLKPEMSAKGVLKIVLDAIAHQDQALIVVNFANCDMVGHTGVFEAAVRAVETVDHCLGEILLALDKVGGQAVIIADHGNAEQMINYEDGSPYTSHTTYPVPVIVYGRADIKSVRSGGALCDVAPTVLQLMSLPQPPEMTGKSLI